MSGLDVVLAHEEIVAIVRSRLGQNHADLLAQPRRAADGGVGWYTNLSGSVMPVSQLQSEERERVAKRAAQMLADLRSLGEAMKSEGPATVLVGQMLESAVRTPAGDWLYVVGGKPVLVLWGHADAPASGEVPPVASRAAAPAAFAAKPGAAAIAAGAPAASSGGWRRPTWLWLIPLALLLALFALLYWGKPWQGRSADEFADQIAAAQGRNRELEAELAKRKGPQREFMCVPEPQAPPLEDKKAEELPKPPAGPPPAPKKAEPALAPAPKAEAPPPQKAEPKAETPSVPPPVAKKGDCKSRGPGDEPEVILIVDASGSMNKPFDGADTRLDAAKRAADSMIRGLPGDVDVALIDFDDCGKVRRDKFYKPSERGSLISEIRALKPRAGTPLAEAIQRSGSVASTSADAVVVVVSDGDDSCGGDPCRTAREVHALNPKVRVNVIDLSVNPRDREVLRCIAEAGGGRVLSPGSSLDLNRSMKEAVGAASCT